MSEPALKDQAYPLELRCAEAGLLNVRRQAGKEGAATPSDRDPLSDAVGFALSGGGIRSATFCLGIFQGLASRNLLGKIDYLSSVSGGGYFASFLGRLFTRDDIDSVEEIEGILNPDETADHKTPAPTGWKLEVFRWLRENGRYLAPRGSGDLLFDLAIVFRNWIAVQVVNFFFLLFIFLTAQLVRGWIETTWFRVALDPYLPFGQSFWWSPYILIAIAILLIIAAPAGWGYWLVESSSSQNQFPPVLGAAVAVAFALVVAMSGFANSKIFWLSMIVVVDGILAIGAWAAAVRFAGARATKVDNEMAFGPPAAKLLFVENQARNWLSQALKIGLVAAASTGGVALVDSVGQTVYVWSATGSLTLRVEAIFASIYVLVAGVAPFGRWLFTSLAGKANDKRLPVSGKAIATLVSLTILALALLLPDAISHAVAWQWQLPSSAPIALRKCILCRVPPLLIADRDMRILVFAALATLTLSLMFGGTWTFLNRSTLHALYTARLARAYLGASNNERYDKRSQAHDKAILRQLNLPARGDDIDQPQYWPPLGPGKDPSRREGSSTSTPKTPYSKGGPIHLINVTINETLDGRSQIQQQDRKGIGLAMGPAGASVGVVHHAVFNVDAAIGEQYNDARILPKKGFRVFEYSQSDGKTSFRGEKLSLGNWTGISGAAFTTGLGFRTSLGLSFLAGFFNVRLGYWWDSGVAPRRRPERPAGTIARQIGAFFNTLFPVQTYLFDEFLARFHGTARRQWYLSDGGHFENMGGYELIRRRLPMIVIIDAEEDRDYTFEGLSNFVRKARLDFAAEIRFLTEEELDTRVNPELRKYFGTLEQLRRGKWTKEPVIDPATRDESSADGRKRLHLKPVEERLSLAHAALAKVYYDGSNEHGSTLLLIKPTLTGDEPVDVLQYHSSYLDFPHESTADQFFSEAQWESYRRLGRHIADKLFAPATGDLFQPRMFQNLPL